MTDATKEKMEIAADEVGDFETIFGKRGCADPPAQDGPPPSLDEVNDHPVVQSFREGEDVKEIELVRDGRINEMERRLVTRTPIDTDDPRPPALRIANL